MAKRNFQQIHTYTFDKGKFAGIQKTEKSSFLTLENAIENAKFWIKKEEPWINTTVDRIEIVNKETKEVVWEYKA